MKTAIFVIFALALSFSAQAAELPDYLNPEQSTNMFSEVCEDGSTTVNFLQKNPVDNYYMVYETTAKSSVVLIRIIWFSKSSKITGIDYYVKPAGAEPKKTEKQEWSSGLKQNAPEYILYMNGDSKKCKVVSSK
jgi:hypothetical protein